VIPPKLRSAGLARAIAVNDSTLRQVIWRKFDVYAVAGKNFYVVPAQAAGDVCEDDMPVVEFDGECRAREHLFDAAENLERRFPVVLRGFCFGSAWICVAIAGCYNEVPFTIKARPRASKNLDN